MWLLITLLGVGAVDDGPTHLVRAWAVPSEEGTGKAPTAFQATTGPLTPGRYLLLDVDGLIAEELLGLDSFVDRTSGRDFGPDWILSHGLIPLSYWAMRKKYEELGFEGLFALVLVEAKHQAVATDVDLADLASR